MTALGRAAVVAAGTFAMLGARGAVPGVTGSTPQTPLAPGVVLANYASALATLPRPKTLSFEYSVAQLGLRNLEQTHRVYRSGLHERDETLIVDGTKFRHPAIRILDNRTNRYDIAAVAPKASTYAFAFAGVSPNANALRYVFKTRPHAAAAFAVTEISVDGRSFLPSVVRFKIASGNARGSGELQYGPSNAYWLVRQAQVNVKLRNGSTAHERIAWTNYQFPAALPPSTFEAPRATPSPLPAIATPAPAPTPPPAVEPL